MTTYETAMRALDEGKIVVCTPGIDADGDKVICTSTFRTTGHGDEHLFDPDPRIRAAYLLGIAQAAREGLRKSHGIRC